MQNRRSIKVKNKRYKAKGKCNILVSTPEVINMTVVSIKNSDCSINFSISDVAVSKQLKLWSTDHKDARNLSGWTGGMVLGVMDMYDSKS